MFEPVKSPFWSVKGSSVPPEVSGQFFVKKKISGNVLQVDVGVTTPCPVDFDVNLQVKK